MKGLAQSLGDKAVGYKLGVDVGGTFTDFLLISDNGDNEIYKVLSTPEDPSIGVINGLKMMADSKGIELKKFIDQIKIIVHGTTVTTNAVLTEKGAKTGLLTTKGFRDALQLRRGIKEEPYNNKYKGPAPIVPRYLRVPITERINYPGEILTPIDHQEVINAVKKFKDEGCKAIAVCFMHSYANRKNEEIAADIIKKEFPEAYLTISSELLPQIGYYERTSTTVLNCYVGPMLKKYLVSLTRSLKEVGFKGILLIMQSNGGIMAPTVAIKTPASTLLSGPAAGPIAGLSYAGIHGYGDCITIDMGGTSFDVALIKDEKPSIITDSKINGHLLALPMLAIYTIGAGGGSIGWVDEGGLLHMGPQSAGANPGPACYNMGGNLPTCTDADLILGYLNKDFFFGGKIPLNYEKAEEAVKKYIADPLRIDLIEAAAGMYQLINVNMAEAIKEVSVKRGYDPREFLLVVAGGAGPIHAGMIALELKIPTIIIPKESSVFCAVGMLMSDLKHDFVRTYHSLLTSLNMKKFKSLIKEMENEGCKLLIEEKVPKEKVRYLYSCDMRYVGQFHEVKVEITKPEIEDEGNMIKKLEEKFHQTHESLYGYCLKEQDNPIETINLRVISIGETEKPQFKMNVYNKKNVSKMIKGERKVYIHEKKDFAEVRVYDGMMIQPSRKVFGPAIIEQVNTTVFVPPAYDIICDKYGNYIMNLKSIKRGRKRRALNEGRQ